MNHTGQKSQYQSRFSGNIDALAFVDSSALYTSVRFWMGNVSFTERFSNFDLARRVDEINEALSVGCLEVKTNDGKRYRISERLLCELNNIFSYRVSSVGCGGYDADTPGANGDVKPCANASADSPVCPQPPSPDGGKLFTPIVAGNAPHPCADSFSAAQGSISTGAAFRFKGRRSTITIKKSSK